VPTARSQVRGLIVLLTLLIAFLAIRLALNPQTISDRAPSQNNPADDLADRLDPNTATEPELAAIPDMGEKRATAIVQFRDQFHTRHPDQPAFAKLSDLEQITGIGPATAQNMEPYFMFPQNASIRP
jgi:DNA uptake protein ComE-like DNA-binding protein